MNTLLVLLTIHFVADFCLQSDWQATQKSKRWDALGLHVAIYTACFSWFGAEFMAITFLTHIVTDAITSRITSKLWFFRMRKGAWRHIDVPSVRGQALERERLYNPFVAEGGNRHWFFVAIGADQLIHAWTLGLTARYLGISL